MFFKLKILILRILGYDKPLRVAFLKYLSLKFKKFRPHYETILLESTIEAKKLGYKEVSILELGVAGGNGIISLENYKSNCSKNGAILFMVSRAKFSEGYNFSNDLCRAVILIGVPNLHLYSTKMEMKKLFYNYKKVHKA